MAVRRHGLMEATRSRGSDNVEQIWGGAMASGKHGNEDWQRRDGSGGAKARRRSFAVRARRNAAHGHIGRRGAVVLNREGFMGDCNGGRVAALVVGVCGGVSCGLWRIEIDEVKPWVDLI
ncbi:hypothetical protein M0R45_035350 [Rubus argutus]|uniref:Uncharacterized protein n=1 Tax=Rubus argutus TaxID=59490 RepID=A0AAW1VWI9_RUBAR